MYILFKNHKKSDDIYITDCSVFDVNIKTSNYVPFTHLYYIKKKSRSIVYFAKPLHLQGYYYISIYFFFKYRDGFEGITGLVFPG